MAQTWNPSHSNLTVALSGGNLIATSTTGSTTYAPVFGTESFSTGKFYWEDVAVASAAGDSAGGLGNTSSSIANGQYLGIASNTLGWQGDGHVWNNNSSIATYATYGSGSRRCFSLDLTNGKIWFRVGTAGNWNNDVIGNQNPATNTGGLAIPAGVTAAQVVPAASVAISTIPDSSTAFFALASWAGTAPSGFGPFDSAASLFPPWPSPGFLQLGA